MPTGDKAVLIYAFPKYHLEYAETKPHDVRSMLDLGLAKSQTEVHKACADSKIGIYDPSRHVYLRQTFVTVWVTADRTVFDGHKHFIEGAGYTEHAQFVERLLNKKDLTEVPQGPKSSRHPQPLRNPSFRKSQSECCKPLNRPAVA